MAEVIKSWTSPLTAVRDRDRISVRLDDIKSKGEKLIDEFNNLVDEYNRTTKPILFKGRELPAKLAKYEKQNFLIQRTSKAGPLIRPLCDQTI